MSCRSRLVACAMTLPFLVGVLTFAAGPAAAFTAPTIDGVSTQSGPTAGGTAVRITGNHFVGTTAVKFDSVAATSWHVVDDFLITAVTPATAHPSNTLVSVSITANGFAAVSMANAFDYTNATLTLSANSGLINNQAITVTLTGYQPSTQVVIPEFNPLLLSIEQFVAFPATPPNPPYVAPLWTGMTNASGNLTQSVNVLKGASFTTASGGLGYDPNAVCPVNQTTANFLGNPSTPGPKYSGQCMIGVNGAGGSFGQGTLEVPIKFSSGEPTPAAPVLQLAAASAAHGTAVNITASTSVNWNANPFFGSSPTFTNPGETKTVVTLCGFNGNPLTCSATVGNNATVAMTRYFGNANPSPPPTIVGAFSGATAGGNVVLNGPGPWPCTCTVKLSQFRPDGTSISASRAITVT